MADAVLEKDQENLNNEVTPNTVISDDEFDMWMEEVPETGEAEDINKESIDALLSNLEKEILGNRVKTVAENSDEDALNAVLSLDTQTQISILKGEEPNLNIAAQNASRIAEGENEVLTQLIGELREADYNSHQKLIMEDLAAMENGSISPKEGVGNIQASKKAISNLSRIGLDQSKEFRERALIEAGSSLQPKTQQNEAVKFMGGRLSKLLEEGVSKEDYNKTAKLMMQDDSIDLTWYDPTDLIIDTLTFGSTAVGRKAIKAVIKTGSKEAVKKVLKGTSQDIAFGAVAGGFMSTADYLEAGPTLTTISGIIGPVATTYTATLTRAGFREWIKKVATNSPEVMKEIKSATRGERDAYAKAVREALEDGSDIRKPEVVEGESPVVRISKTAIEDQDTALLEKASGLVVSARTIDPDTPSPLTKAIYKSVGGQDFLRNTGLIKNPTIPNSGNNMVRHFNDANSLSSEVGNRVVFESLTAPSEAKKGLDNLNKITLYNDNTGNGRYNVNGVVGVFDKIYDPTNVLPVDVITKRMFASSNVKFGPKVAKELVSEQDFLDKQAKRIEKFSMKAIKDSIKNLSRKETEQMYEALDAINQSGQKFEIKETGIKIGDEEISLSRAQLDSLSVHNQIMDWHWRKSNSVLSRIFSNKGLKWDALKEKPIEVLKKNIGEEDSSGKILTQELYDQGFRLTRRTNRKDKTVIELQTPDRLKNTIRDLNENDKMFSKREYYNQILYTDLHTIYRVERTPDGAVELDPVATAPYFDEAEKTIRKLKDSDSSGTFISVRKGDNIMETAATKGTLDTLHTLGHEELKSLKAALKEQGLEKAQVDNFINNIKFLHKQGKGFMKDRASQRLLNADLTGPAPMLPSEEAVGKYLGMSSKFISSGDYTVYLKDKYLKTFGQYLTNPNDWLSEVKKAGGISFEERAAAKTIQNHIKMISNMPTKSEILTRQFQDSVAKSLYEKGYLKNLGHMLEKNNMLRSTTNNIRALSFHTLLGLGNISSGIIQLTGLLNPTGRYSLSRPLDTLRGRNPLIGGAKDTIAIMTGADRALKKEIVDSGFLTETGVQQMLEDTNRFLKTWGKATSIFFNAGEAVQKTYGWATARRDILNRIDSGEFKFKPGSREYFLKLHEEASINSLNMSKINQPAYAKNMWGIPFQFVQFSTHQAELFGIDKRVSALERLGIWGSWVSAFGLSGVPFLPDVIVGAENVGVEVGKPETVGLKEKIANNLGEYMTKGAEEFDVDIDKEFWSSMIHKGGISTLTDGQLDLANRATLSFSLNPIFQFSGWETLAGPGLNILGKIVGGEIESVVQIKDHWEDLTSSEINRKLLRPVQRALPSLNRRVQAINALIDDSKSIYSSDGELIVDDATRDELISQAIGVEPSRIQEIKKTERLSRKISKAWRYWSDARAEEIASRFRAEDYEGASKLLSLYLDDIMEGNPSPSVLADYQRSVLFAITKTLVPKEHRQHMDELKIMMQLKEEKGVD